MKVEVHPSELHIVPENHQDAAYLVHVIGLFEKGATAQAVRQDEEVGFGTDEGRFARVVMSKKQVGGKNGQGVGDG